MPSTSRTALYTLAASTCILSTLVPSSDAFWLIPGSSRRHDDTLATRGDAGILEKVKHAVPGAKSTPPASVESPLADLLRALEEVTTDVEATASLAKSTLLRGMYLRQNEDEYVLAMDVPGLHTNELQVIADRGTLRIKGEHKCPNMVGTETPDPLCIERYYDAAFTFPSDADEQDAEARLDAGVAYVRVPKLKGERRGVGRVLKLSGDAAEWVYRGTGAKTVVDKTKEALEKAKDGIVKGATKATDTVKGTANDASNAARDAANEAARLANAATESIKNAGAQATDGIKNAGAQATEVVVENPEGKGFVERMHDTIVKPIADRIGKQGSSEGQVPVERKDEL